ncbi:S8 family serine peptidase [Microcystis sp. M62BS1]|uniref:S8 family serine peptidase n=1 Tax=Microcystis sp. M62BS1 TaxID=2771204 RepID=UPI0025885AD9|nr:S8 family serine peptidase [Microcystis sp. M62BS1]MCA2506080.1 S8 family serine peptidase [Microcystis sp. M62BS1]
MKTTQVSSDLSSTNMTSPADSLSFEQSFPITFDLTGSHDLTVSRETSPLGVLNSNPSPSKVSSEAPTVPVSPATTSQVVFPASLSINSSGYPTSPASSPASVPTAAPVTTSPASGPASVPTADPVTSELEPAATSTLAPYAPNQLIVKFKQGIASAQVAQFQSLFGAVSTQTIRLTGAQVWKLSGSLSVEKILAKYRSNPIFEYIQPDYIRTLGTISTQATFPNDPSFNQLWGLHNTGQNGGTPDADIDAPEAWDIQTGNPNLVIGVIDTGVDYNHPDLAGNIWTNPGEIAGDGIDNDGNGYIDDIHGWDFAYNDNDPSDVHGHGTHVSGTIAGKGNNGVGVTGVAWNAKIMPLKFLNDQGSGSTSNAILAINYATAKGVKLTNNSWGGGVYSQALYDAINAAGQAGALFIAAAGNDAKNTDTSPSYPASYDLPNIISVASTTRTDALSSFSNYGLTSVDLGAPGSDIYSLAPGGGYATLSGTSMASPHVTGAAALLWSQNPTWTAQQVKNTLMNTGDPIAALAGKTVSGKRLNVFNALAANLPSVTVSVSPASVQEDGTTNLVYTFTRTNLNLSSPLTVNFGASGIANAAPVGSDPADYNLLTGSAVTFDPTTKLGTVTFAPGATTATVEVDPIADTVQENSESVILTVNSGTGYIDGSPNTATGTIISEEGFTTYFSDDFANNSQGWTLGTEWQIGAATTSTGQNYGNPDPGTDNTPTADNGVAGVVIGGNASTALHGFYYLTSPVINTSTANQLFFEFARWLNSDYTPYMQNTVEIFNGSSWVNLWSSGASPEVQDNAWTPQQFDISAYKSASTQIRFGFNVGSSDVYTVSSWNLDDVKIYGDGGVTTKSISIAKTTDGNEAGPVSSVFTLTRTGDLSSALTVNYTLAGTATLGSDYNDPSLGQATFAAGADKATITLPTKDDLLSEPSETIITTITAPAGYTITGPDTATATIIDDDLGTLTLVKTTDGKEAGPVSSVFTLTRTGDLSSALTVNYTLGGTATPGVDYTGTTPNSVTFAAGSSKATITLPTKDDLLSEPSETIITTITAPVGYTISGPDTATATILDNDGNLDNNNLVGTSFADALAGGGGNDTLNGAADNDTLDGGVGVDLMDGGDNNDTYYVDNVGDIVKESSDDALGGTADTVFASVTYSLAPGTPGKQGYGIENLTLTGDANINATGNGKNNVLTGNSGSNVLNGGLGNDTLNGDLGLDTLTGGAGNDFFRFDNVENSDLITDFSVANDTIILANSLDGTLTGSLGMGIKGLVFNSANANGSVLNAAWFFKGAGFTGGASGNPAGIYVNTSNGDIWYNDSTVVGSYLMANVGAGAAAGMTNLDFVYRV